MIHKLVLICFLFTCHNLFTQNTKLENDLIKYKDSIKALNFTEITDEFKKNKTKDLNRNKVICARFLKDLSENNYSELEKCRANYYLWDWEFANNRYEKSINYANSFKIAAEKMNDNYRVSIALNCMGLSQVQLGEFTEALNSFSMGFTSARKDNNVLMENVSSGNLVKLKIFSHDYDEAISLAKKIIIEVNENASLSKSLFYPVLYSNITEAFLLNGDISNAKYYNSLGIEVATKYNSHLEYNLICKSRIKIHEKKYTEALQILNNIRKIKTVDAYGYNNLALLHLYKGKTFYLKGMYKKAIQELLFLEEIKKTKHINRLNVQESYSLLAESFKQLKKKDSALLYYEKAIATFTKNEKKRILLISEIDKKFDKKEFEEALKKESLIDSKYTYEKYIALEKEYDLLQKTKQKGDTFLIYGGISLITLLLIIGGHTFHSNKKNQQKFTTILKQLEHKNTPLDNKQQNHTTKSSINNDLNEATITTISKGLKRLENQEYFLKKECNTTNVAKKLKTNTSYLSKFMNTHYQCSFNTYINHLRINYAITRLKNDPVFRSYTVLAISEELGYKSVNTFTKIFKNETGILPSYYIKKLKKEIPKPPAS